MLFGTAASVVFSLVAQIGEQVDFLRFLPRDRRTSRTSWRRGQAPYRGPSGRQDLQQERCRRTSARSMSRAYRLEVPEVPASMSRYTASSAGSPPRKYAAAVNCTGTCGTIERR